VNPDTVRLVLVCLCWPVVVLRIPAVRVADQNLLWFTLAMQGLGLTILQTPVMRLIQSATGIPRVESLLSSLLATVVAVLLLTVALRVSAFPGERRWSRVMAGYCAATAVTMTLLFWVVTADRIPTRDRFLPALGTFTAHTAYWIVYLTYMLVVTSWTTFLFWRQILRVAAKVLRFALFALAVGTTTFLVFLGGRVVALFSTSPQVLTFGVYVSSIYSISVTVGCSLAIIMPLSQSAVQWWRANRLYALWRALCDASPHIALHPRRGRLVDALPVVDSRHRLHRRIVEIRDGLLIMREWVTQCTYDRIVASLQGVPNREALATAVWVRMALQARADGRDRVDKPLDLARLGGVDEDSELAWLTEVAKAWSSPLAAKYAVTVDEPVSH